MSREKLANLLSWESVGEPLSRASSTALRGAVWEVQREINKALLGQFYLPDNPEKRSSVYFKQKQGKIFSAELKYFYASIPLSRYPVSQQRVTKNKQVLAVKRGGQFARRGTAFVRKIVPSEEIFTYVQIRRGSPPKLVKGVLGYMGWLHTGRRTGAGRFSAHIFERNQQATWQNGKRLPVHALWGPSLTQLLQTREMKTAVDRILERAGIEKKIDEAFAKQGRVV